ncbi:COQ9 family protein [Celeribacter indicus]|uniref:Ubiquinone biosynthesis protein COQ9 n=1 Tax=Celeribacter indicus TaxID=1208324 RepID=A0A0B5E694_9RHOB|nr:COQ9 family protein [Celeribacter indicus]AJE48935.1 ubiquinone biosynthesis protein COQ9 [Celeribacter indicus]SDW41646.1 ubiquinone biosynthesis protein COQ9 [Celeribacter indicus]
MQSTAYPDPTRENLLDAALPHVVFDGWGPETFRAAVSDSGVSPALARVAAPRGSVDLAAAYHKRGDRAMIAALGETDLSALRFRDRIAHAVWLRLQSVDREVVRRGMSLFSLPHNAPEGTRLLWETADAIWTALDDTSRDVNWYTKRATLAGVFASTVLFWLGDDSEGFMETRAFLERRIDDVMQIEKAKAGLRGNKVFSAAFALPNALIGMIRAPAGAGRTDVPGTRSTPPGGAQ